MFSKELQELDRNTVSYMIDEMQEEINQQKAEIEEQRDAIQEKDAEIEALKKQLASLQG